MVLSKSADWYMPLVLLICLVASFSYLPLFGHLRAVRADETPVLYFKDGEPLRKDAGGPPKFRTRKQVSWLHMHKFGGTFITEMAKLQGEVFPPGSINANWMPDFCSTPQAQRVLCVERTTQGVSDISWSAMERELDEGDFCDAALMGTMLRQPLSALQSVLVHDRFDSSEILETLRSCSEKAPAKHFMYRPRSNTTGNLPACLPAWDTYQHFDNFATRTLAGAYSQAPCSITHVHLEAAKAQLQRMDVLTILEEVSEHMPQLQDFFHWNITLVQPRRRVNKKKEEDEGQVLKSDGAFTSTEMTFLKQVNAIDLELYEFAVSLARNMTVKAQDNIAKRGDLLVSPGEQIDSLGHRESKLIALRKRVADRLQLRGRRQ